MVGNPCGKSGKKIVSALFFHDGNVRAVLVYKNPGLVIIIIYCAADMLLLIQNENPTVFLFRKAPGRNAAGVSGADDDQIVHYSLLPFSLEAHIRLIQPPVSVFLAANKMHGITIHENG